MYWTSTNQRLSTSINRQLGSPGSEKCSANQGWSLVRVVSILGRVEFTGVDRKSTIKSARSGFPRVWASSDGFLKNKHDRVEISIIHWTPDSYTFWRTKGSGLEGVSSWSFQKTEINVSITNCWNQETSSVRQHFTIY